MVYASILVHLDLSADSLRRVRLTRELAGLWSARVVGLCAAEPSGGSLLGNAPSTLRVQHAARLKDACDTQQDHFSMIADGVPLEWRSGTGSPLAFLARNACVADLVVIGRAAPESAGPDFHLTPHEAVMVVGRPVLVVPPDVERLVADHVVVAWKTGRPAALAVQPGRPAAGLPVRQPSQRAV